MRGRSRQKRITSRCQTIFMARRSFMRVRSGTRMAAGASSWAAMAIGQPLRRAKGWARILSCAEASASRMVVPVNDMKTSSSEGRARFTERMGTPSSAKRRGMKRSPSATAKRTAPSWTPASIWNRSRSAATAAASSAVRICTTSLPTGRP